MLVSLLRGRVRGVGQGGASCITNRIHVDDVIGILVLILENTVMQRGGIVDIVNVSDDCPATVESVQEFGDLLLYEAGLKDVRADTHQEKYINARDRKRKSKKVSNNKLKKLLTSDLKYPSYKEGLRAELERLLTQKMHNADIDEYDE
uniref:NAD-dependent epimerase/dehydratase domain-containing protein n=1 Tax=Timspurckia oligopyrenoides TaxID=708627 RepID=A0A7S0ZJ27_9RHOD|mmetsp:Transcript_7229/g.13029  ORF Transcript_7229/g.13029 Transcript_7229/m.13029 type:complete len:148 (+) Transcript_7229:902-1345(+)